MNCARKANDIVNLDSRRVKDAPVGWGAALIDERGNEIPITEGMVQRACDELARSWTFPRQHAAAS